MEFSENELGKLPFFYNTLTDESVWVHPNENQCKQIIKDKRNELNEIMPEGEASEVDMSPIEKSNVSSKMNHAVRTSREMKKRIYATTKVQKDEEGDGGDKQVDPAEVQAERLRQIEANSIATSPPPSLDDVHAGQQQKELKRVQQQSQAARSKPLKKTLTSSGFDDLFIDPSENIVDVMNRNPEANGAAAAAGSKSKPHADGVPPGISAFSYDESEAIANPAAEPGPSLLAPYAAITVNENSQLSPGQKQQLMYQQQLFLQQRVFQQQQEFLAQQQQQQQQHGFSPMQLFPQSGELPAQNMQVFSADPNGWNTPTGGLSPQLQLQPQVQPQVQEDQSLQQQQQQMLAQYTLGANIQTLPNGMLVLQSPQGPIAVPPSVAAQIQQQQQMRMAQEQQEQQMPVTQLQSQQVWPQDGDGWQDSRDSRMPPDGRQQNAQNIEKQTGLQPDDMPSVDPPQPQPPLPEAKAPPTLLEQIEQAVTPLPTQGGGARIGGDRPVDGLNIETDPAAAAFRDGGGEEISEHTSPLPRRADADSSVWVLKQLLDSIGFSVHDPAYREQPGADGALSPRSPLRMNLFSTVGLTRADTLFNDCSVEADRIYSKEIIDDRTAYYDAVLTWESILSLEEVRNGDQKRKAAEKEKRRLAAAAAAASAASKDAAIFSKETSKAASKTSGSGENGAHKSDVATVAALAADVTHFQKILAAAALNGVSYAGSEDEADIADRRQQQRQRGGGGGGGGGGSFGGSGDDNDDNRSSERKLSEEYSAAVSEGPLSSYSSKLNAELQAATAGDIGGQVLGEKMAKLAAASRPNRLDYSSSGATESQQTFSIKAGGSHDCEDDRSDVKKKSSPKRAGAYGYSGLRLNDDKASESLPSKGAQATGTNSGTSKASTDPLRELLDHPSPAIKHAGAAGLYSAAMAQAQRNAKFSPQKSPRRISPLQSPRRQKGADTSPGAGAGAGNEDVAALYAHLFRPTLSKVPKPAALSGGGHSVDAKVGSSGKHVAVAGRAELSPLHAAAPVGAGGHKDWQAVGVFDSHKASSQALHRYQGIIVSSMQHSSTDGDSEVRREQLSMEAADKLRIRRDLARMQWVVECSDPRQCKILQRTQQQQQQQYRQKVLHKPGSFDEHDDDEHFPSPPGQHGYHSNNQNHLMQPHQHHHQYQQPTRLKQVPSFSNPRPSQYNLHAALSPESPPTSPSNDSRRRQQQKQQYGGANMSNSNSKRGMLAKKKGGKYGAAGASVGQPFMRNRDIETVVNMRRIKEMLPAAQPGPTPTAREQRYSVPALAGAGASGKRAAGKGKGGAGIDVSRSGSGGVGGGK